MAGEKKETLFRILFSVQTALSALLCIMLILHLLPEANIVCVSDGLIEVCEKNYDESLKKKNIQFVAQNSIAQKTESTFRKKPRIVGSLTLQKELPLTGIKEDTENARTFTMSTRAILPVIEDDFSERKLLPAESISFSTPEEIPENHRALLVSGRYAGESDYELLEKTNVRAVVYEQKLADLIFSWCEKTFLNEEKQQEKTVIISSVGDIMVARGVQEVLLSENGVEKVFGNTLPLIKESDFAIGNLEGVVTDSWENAIKTYTFKFKKAILPKLLDAGFDYIMQTNNHCYDYGESGFKDTLRAFEEYNVPTSGVGYNLEEAKKFYLTNVNGLDIAVISCGAFPVERSGFDGKKTATATQTRAGILWQSDELLSDVKTQKENGKFVIVNVHGGEEYHFFPTKKQREFYESLCENGADIVFGSHPHVIQKSEWYKGSLIVYSMGNFIFNGMEDMRGGTDSEIVRVGVVNGKVSYVEHYPVAIGVSKVSLK